MCAPFGPSPVVTAAWCSPIPLVDTGRNRSPANVRRTGSLAAGACHEERRERPSEPLHSGLRGFQDDGCISNQCAGSGVARRPRSKRARAMENTSVAHYFPQPSGVSTPGAHRRAFGAVRHGQSKCQSLRVGVAVEDGGQFVARGEEPRAGRAPSRRCAARSSAASASAAASAGARGVEAQVLVVLEPVADQLEADALDGDVGACRRCASGAAGIEERAVAVAAVAAAGRATDRARARRPRRCCSRARRRRDSGSVSHSRMRCADRPARRRPGSASR